MTAAARTSQAPQLPCPHWTCCLLTFPFPHRPPTPSPQMMQQPSIMTVGGLDYGQNPTTGKPRFSMCMCQHAGSLVMPRPLGSVAAMAAAMHLPCRCPACPAAGAGACSGCAHMLLSQHIITMRLVPDILLRVQGGPARAGGQPRWESAAAARCRLLPRASSGFVAC